MSGVYVMCVCVWYVYVMCGRVCGMSVEGYVVYMSRLVGCSMGYVCCVG